MIGKVPKKILRLIFIKFMPLPLTESWISTSLSPATQLEKSLPHKSNRPILITTKYFHIYQQLNYFDIWHKIEHDFGSKSLCYTFTTSGTLVVSDVQMCFMNSPRIAQLVSVPLKWCLQYSPRSSSYAGAAQFPKSVCPFHLGVSWLTQSHPLNLLELRFWTSCIYESLDNLQ